MKTLIIMAGLVLTMQTQNVEAQSPLLPILDMPSDITLHQSPKTKAAPKRKPVKAKKRTVPKPQIPNVEKTGVTQLQLVWKRANTGAIGATKADLAQLLMEQQSARRKRVRSGILIYFGVSLVAGAILTAILGSLLSGRSGPRRTFRGICSGSGGGVWC